MRIVYLDTETTGLDPDVHEIIEVAYVGVDTESGLMDEYHALVRPEHPERMQAKAAALNGYDAEKWAAEGVDPASVAQRLSQGLSRAVLAAYNLRFDEGFLRALLRRYKLPEKPWQHRVLDVMQLAMPLWIAGRIDDVKLATVARFLGLGEQGAVHGAARDVELCRNVARLLTTPVLSCYTGAPSR